MNKFKKIILAISILTTVNTFSTICFAMEKKETKELNLNSYFHSLNNSQHDQFNINNTSKIANFLDLNPNDNDDLSPEELQNLYIINKNINNNDILVKENENKNKKINSIIPCEDEEDDILNICKKRIQHFDKFKNKNSSDEKIELHFKAKNKENSNSTKNLLKKKRKRNQ